MKTEELSSGFLKPRNVRSGTESGIKKQNAQYILGRSKMLDILIFNITL